MKLENLIKQVWEDIYNPNLSTIDTINKYFHLDYEQCINGSHMNRQEYINHVFEQKKNIKIDLINYKHVLEKNDELFAIYYPKGKNKDGQIVKAEVIAYFHVKNQKIYRIHGQVHLIEGSTNDVDM